MAPLSAGRRDERTDQCPEMISDRRSSGSRPWVRVSSSSAAHLGESCYGANSLLTDEWGCRWFSPKVKRIPKHERLTLKVTDRRYQPPFEWRDGYFWSGLDNEWAFHNFQNKNFTKLQPEQGWRAGFVHNLFVHTALDLVPPERYRETHPDYFWTGVGDEPRIGGRHDSETLGICLTSPEVAEVAAESIFSLRRQRLDESNLMFSVSASDGVDDWCQCPNCMDF